MNLVASYAFAVAIGFLFGIVAGIAYTLHAQADRREWEARRREQQLRRLR